MTKQLHSPLRSPRFPCKPAGETSAFTLIELLVGIIISTLIIGATFSAYIAARDSWEQSRVYSRQYQNARVALTLIEQHLRAAIEPNSRAGIVFEGTDTPIDLFADSTMLAESEIPQETDSTSTDPFDTTVETTIDTGPQSDRLRFVSSGNPVFPGSRLRSDICQVEFFISSPGDLLNETGSTDIGTIDGTEQPTASPTPLGTTSGDGTEIVPETDAFGEPFRPALMMRRFPMPTDSNAFSEDSIAFDYDSTALLLTEEEAVDTAIELASGVISFNVQYYDGLDWLDEWITTNELPRAVEIRLVFAEPGHESNAVTVAKLVAMNTCTTEPINLDEFDIGTTEDMEPAGASWVNEGGNAQ